ncbi:MAG TPA: stearoyl-CoA 9-desaturase [Caballeronia sp.]|nr:stearoyl-CoA 9-desaturase [Caballeronia sp.]
MSTLPSFVQPLITQITGKPLHSREKRFDISFLDSIFLPPCAAFLSICVIFYILSKEILSLMPMIPVFWIAIVWMLRKIQVTHLHHAIHQKLFVKSWKNKWYGKIMPSLVIIQNSQDYKHDHFAHHAKAVFATRLDGDAAFLARLGFLPGRSKAELWLNLWITMLSPVFHGLFAWLRLRSAFTGNKALTTLVAVGNLILIFEFGLLAWCVAVFLPCFVLYQISALLQFLTEHAWNVSDGPVKTWTEYENRCWARFCGERYPVLVSQTRSAHIAGVLRWTIKMAFLHLPTRAACLVGDLPVHDWHHLAPRAGQNPGDWKNGIFNRQAAIEQGDNPGFSTRELWGLKNMISHQFNLLSSIAVLQVVPEDFIKASAQSQGSR